MDINQRIAQFENMCREDQENDMAWFSLGGAYNQAARYAEAAEAYTKCIAHNQTMSKAYQLAGVAYMACQEEDRAIDILTKGYLVAAQLGNMLPRNEIAVLLEQLGADLPQIDEKQVQASSAGGGSFVCQRTGKAGTKMDSPPFRGAVGEWIAQNISKETFDAWIAQGTKVINELRLDLSRDEDNAMYDQHMYEYLGIDEQLLESLQTKANT